MICELTLMEEFCFLDKGIEVLVNLQTGLFANLIFISFSWCFPCADEYVYMFYSLLLSLLESYQ